MRVLIMPLGYENTEEHKDLVNAFNADHQAMLYNGSIIDAINFKPEIVFYQGGSETVKGCLELKGMIGCKFLAWTGDCRYYPMQWLMDCRELVDAYLLPFTGQVFERHRHILHKPCFFHWEYMQDWRYRDFKEMDSGRVIFIGNVNHSIPGGHDRQELINFLNDRVPEFEAWGSAEHTSGTLPIEEMPDYYNDSYLVIAENNFHDVDNYYTPRNMSGMAAGSCTLMREFPGIDDIFNEGFDGFYYRHKYELLDLIQFLQANPGIRNYVAAWSRKDVGQRWSMEAWVNKFIQIANGIISK